jgi:organic radical activating enzyme
VGGEPLLLPENERLLDVIPKDCVVTLITNMSVNLTKNKIFDKLVQRQKVGWSISFDNTGSRFEYVRHGGNWTLLVENIYQIKELFAQGHWGGIHAVYNIYNATQLSDFIEWTKFVGIDTHWQSLYQPECLDPLKHSQAIKSLAKTELNRVLARTDLTNSERAFFEQAQNNYQKSTGVVLTNEFKQHIQEIENNYHQDQQGQFAQLWPEVHNTL